MANAKAIYCQIYCLCVKLRSSPSTSGRLLITKTSSSTGQCRATEARERSEPISQGSRGNCPSQQHCLVNHCITEASTSPPQQGNTYIISLTMANDKVSPLQLF